MWDFVIGMLFGMFFTTTIFALSGKSRRWLARIDDIIDDEALEEKIQAKVDSAMSKT